MKRERMKVSLEIEDVAIFNKEQLLQTGHPVAEAESVFMASGWMRGSVNGHLISWGFKSALWPTRDAAIADFWAQTHQYIRDVGWLLQKPPYEPLQQPEGDVLLCQSGSM